MPYVLAIVISLCALSAYGQILDPSDIAESFVDYYEQGNTDVIKVLKERGYQLQSLDYSSQSLAQKTIDRSYRDLQDSQNYFARIEEIRRIGQFKDLEKWKDVMLALGGQGYAVELKYENELRFYSHGRCEQHFKKISQKTEYRRCQFKIVLTREFFLEDTDICKTDIANVFDASSGKTKDQLLYVCMRRKGWKDPHSWKNNIQLP